MPTPERLGARRWSAALTGFSIWHSAHFPFPWKMAFPRLSFSKDQFELLCSALVGACQSFAILHSGAKSLLLPVDIK